MKRNTLAKEAFDWMQSLDLPRKPAQVRFGYFDDMMDSTENSEHTSVAECKEEALKRSFITWINNHKSRYALKMGMLQREVDCAIRIMDMRIKNTFSVLKHFVQHSSLSVSAVQTQILREQGLTMKWIYKRRMYLLYWFVRSKNRRRMRSMWFKRWGHHRNGRNLVTKGLWLRVRLIKRAAFQKWKRRYKWPLVATQRNTYASKQALARIAQRTSIVARMKMHSTTAELTFTRNYWSVLMTHIQYHRRSIQRSSMGKDIFLMRCVSKTLHIWEDYTTLRCRIHDVISKACTKRRAKHLLAALASWQKHAQLAVKKVVKMKTSYLFYKRKMFHIFLRGVRHYLQQGETSMKSDSAVKRRKTRFFVFRGVLFKKRHTLLRLWRHNMRSIVTQRSARDWGLRWWKRATFRMLQLMCRKRRNQTLISCYGSLQCKARSMRSCLYIWRQRTLLATSLDALASYAFKKKFILAWRKRGQLVQKQLFLQRRAGLRWALNRQRFALHQWYRNITQERHCRYSLRVFRKLHPVPAVSIIKRVFLAWKYEYTQFRKEQKKVFRQVVSIRKTCTKKRFLSAWFDTFECCSVNKRQMLRAMKALYKLSARRKWSIQQLSNALILHTSAPRMHSLRAFLVAKGLMIHTRVEQEYFHTLCFVRKYMHLWREYSVTRRQQSVQYHRAYKTAVRQCSYHFACAYRTHNKHRKWVQWRGLKCWYQLLVKRRNAYASLSTRLWAKQFFYRWMEQYNRKLINYHLQIPSVSVILSPVPPVSQNNHTNSDSRCTDLSCMAHNNTTLQSTFMDTTCATFQSAADRQQKQGHAQGQGHLGAAAAAAEYSTMAVDTSMHVLQYHPSYSRQLQNQRLHSLSRDSRDSGGVRVGGEQLGNLSAISHSSSVHSPIGIFKSSTTGRVLRQAAPRYGKLIEPTRAVPMGLGLSTGNISTSSRVAAQKKPVTLYDKKTPFAQRQRRVAERGAMDLSCSMSSVSTRYEEVDRSGGDGLSVNASMKGGKNYFAAGKPKPLWGRLIEEDKVDAAKRSYSGQYLLSAGRNFLSKGHFAQTK